MATDLEKLVVQLSADIRSFDKELARMNGVTNRQFAAIERRARQMNKNLDGIFARSFDGLKAPLAGISAAFGTAELIRLADTWTELKSRVDLAAGSMESGEAGMMRLSEMARRTYSGLEQTAEGWLSNSTNLKEMGYSTSEQLDLVETLNNALVISAAKGARAASVMSAWSKAMAFGKLSGDNLNTVIQSGGRLSKALADSMGVGVNQLRKLGQAGKITTKDMYGVTSQLEKLRKEADSMPATVGDAIQILKDAFLQYVGGADQASQTSAKLAENIILLADNIGTAADTALQFATIVISALSGRALFGMVAALPAASTSVMALVTAMRAGTLTATGFAAALGPMGLLLGAAAGALYVLSQRQDTADIAAGEHRKALVLLNQEIADLDYANKSAVQSTRDKISVDIAAAKVALERAKAERELARSILEEQIMGRVRDPELGRKIIEKQMGNSLSLFTKEVELQQQIIADLEKSLATLENNVANPPSRIKLGDHPDDDTGKGRKPKKERADEYERLAQRIADSTAAMVAETEVQRQLNPLVEDYGYAVTKARTEQDLLNAALNSGQKDTPALRAQIAALADQYALATVEAKKLGESQDEIRRKAEDMAEFQKDLTRGIVDGFVQGKKAADLFADALTKIGNKLLDMAFDGPFSGKGGSPFDFIGKLLGFSEGGWTGPGPKNKPAGVVHAGEVVWSQDDIRRAGGVAAVEAMRKGMGGMVMPASIQAPTMPKLSSMGGSMSGPQEVNISVNVEGANGDAHVMALVEEGVTRGLRAFPQSAAFKGGVQSSFKTLRDTRGIR